MRLPVSPRAGAGRRGANVGSTMWPPPLVPRLAHALDDAGRATAQAVTDFAKSWDEGMAEAGRGQAYSSRLLVQAMNPGPDTPLWETRYWQMQMLGMWCVVYIGILVEAPQFTWKYIKDLLIGSGACAKYWDMLNGGSLMRW